MEHDLTKPKDMKLVMLQCYFDEKTAPTTNELIGHCNRYFPYWSVTKTEAEYYSKLLAVTNKGPGTMNKRGRSTVAVAPQKSVTVAENKAQSRYLGGLFGSWM